MALLWTQAMAWHDGAGLSHDEAQPISVRKAGFKGYVGGGHKYEYDHDTNTFNRKAPKFDEDLYDETTPEPTSHEQAHYDKHGEYPDSHYERHDQAYSKALEDRNKENEPDLEDEELHTFVSHHGANSDLWKSKGTFGPVDISKGVYATQSHVSQRIMDEHRFNGGESWQHRKMRERGHEPSNDDYLGHDHPMFVTHEGRLHVTEGHHRVGNALQHGESHVTGWHYDADKHGIGETCDSCGYQKEPGNTGSCENCGD